MTKAEKINFKNPDHLHLLLEDGTEKEIGFTRLPKYLDSDKDIFKYYQKDFKKEIHIISFAS